MTLILTRMGLMDGRLLRAMTETEERAAEREAGQMRDIIQAVWILSAGIALAVRIILRFG